MSSETQSPPDGSGPPSEGRGPAHLGDVHVDFSEVATLPPASGRRLDDLGALAKNPLLARLSDAELATFVDLLDQIALPAGTVVVREGDEGDAMYFVLEGEARVHRGAVELRTLTPGAHFGELALVGVRRRAATVEADKVLRLARLSRTRYQWLAVAHPMMALHFVQSLVTAIGDDLVNMTDTVGLLLRQRSLPRQTEVTARLPDGDRAVRTGTSLHALLPSQVSGVRVVAGLMDQKAVSLETPLVCDASVLPLTLASWEGRDVYRRSLSLILLEAASRVWPGQRVCLGPSLSAGRVVLLPLPLGSADERAELARAIGHEMARLVAVDAPMREELWTTEEARTHFLSCGWKEAAALLSIHRDSMVVLVSCGQLYALSSGPLLPSAGAIGPFSLKVHPEGLLLDYGDTVRSQLELHSGLKGDTLDQELAHPRFSSEMAREHRAWLAALGVTSVGELDALCISGKVPQLIRVAEGFHEKRIGKLADRIAGAQGRLRVIAIAGPSSSGKTTFIKRLTVQLEIDGVHPVNLSLDDYYVDRERTPKDPRGEWDFEAIEALDLGLLQDHVARLLRGETVKTARYDFKSGKRHPAGGPELSLREGDVLMLEGIHGLNPRLLGDAVPRERLFTIFIQPSIGLPFDRLESLAPADIRLLRRIVRDRHQRGYEAKENIARWPSVRAGEHRHIFPFQPHADAEFDSSLAYEPSVLKVYAERYLMEVPRNHPAYATAHRLREVLDRFVTIYPDHVPPTSILREFIGGSGFEY